MEFINNEATLLGHFFTICLKITTVKNFKNIGFSSIDLDPQIHSVGILVVFLFFFFFTQTTMVTMHISSDHPGRW